MESRSQQTKQPRPRALPARQEGLVDNPELEAPATILTVGAMRLIPRGRDLLRHIKPCLVRLRRIHDKVSLVIPCDGYDFLHAATFYHAGVSKAEGFAESDVFLWL